MSREAVSESAPDTTGTINPHREAVERFFATHASILDVNLTDDNTIPRDRQTNTRPSGSPEGR